MKDKVAVLEHLQKHQTYPATKEEMVKTCQQLSDFTKEDKQWFEDNLPEGTYNSAQEAILALGLDEE